MFSYAVNVVIAVVVCLARFGHVTRADCPVANISVQSNFNITAYAGRWYELNFKAPYYYGTSPPWMNYYEEYTLDNSTGTPQLNFTAYGRDAGANYTCVGGSNNPPLQVGDMTYPAKLYSVQQVNATNLTLNHWVISTDYVTYAVIYGCLILNTDNITCQSPTAKVHSRTRTITDTTVLNTINSYLTSVCLDTSMMTTVWQNATLCPETTTATTTALPSNVTLPSNATTAQPITTTKGTGTELMASLSTLLLTMLLLVVNYQRHDAAV